MRKSPRTRRLMADHRAIQKLSAESSIFSFEARGTPPEIYRMIFRGLGAWRVNHHEVALRDEHVVIVELGAAYPRMIPSLSWQTPIFHPNISSGGVVCLGGYGTHWVPSLTLDELCTMLWEMIRYKNFDSDSPYNREAAIWAKSQSHFRFPLDQRSLRDLVSSGIRPAEHVDGSLPPVVVDVSGGGTGDDAEIIEAEIVDHVNNDIVFID